MQFPFLYLLIQSVISLSIPTYQDGFTNLPKLNHVNFDSTLYSSPRAIILFGATWCHNTRDFIPEFYDAYTQLRDDNFNLDFYFYDCGSNTIDYEFCHSTHTFPFSVKGYPTVLYFERGIYQKEVYVSEFIDFLRETGVNVDES